MKSPIILSSVLTGLVLLGAACDGGEPAAEITLESDACEHMQDGPIQALTAVADATTADAPDITETHTRYDITLPGDPGALRGVVELSVAEASEVHIFANQDVPMTVSDASGAALTVETKQTAIAECTEVGVGYTFDMEVGTYVMDLGPTDQQTVQIVMLTSAEHSHE